MTRFWNNLYQTLIVKGLKIQITHKSLGASKPMGLGPGWLSELGSWIT